MADKMDQLRQLRLDKRLLAEAVRDLWHFNTLSADEDKRTRLQKLVEWIEAQEAQEAKVPREDD